MKRKMIKSEHHRDQETPLWVVLSDLAAQENCDGSPYDEMQMASEYIKALEEELEPYREIERRLLAVLAHHFNCSKVRRKPTP